VKGSFYMYIFSCTSSGIGFFNVQSSLLRCLGPQLQLSTVLLHDGATRYCCHITAATDLTQYHHFDETHPYKPQVHDANTLPLTSLPHLHPTFPNTTDFPTPPLGTHRLKGELSFES